MSHEGWGPVKSADGKRLWKILSRGGRGRFLRKWLKTWRK
jgi:hypothetical protein